MKRLNILYFAFSAKQLMLIFLFTLLPTMASAQCPDNNHPHMIDLALPSGTKWACCNVGASKPEDYGGYFAWGETSEKRDYTGHYKYINSDTGKYEFIGSDIAGTQYDVAHVKWGGSWVIPNVDQITELIKNCTTLFTTQNGVNGCLFTSSNGASIFLPALGECNSRRLKNLVVGKMGSYWSSSPHQVLSEFAHALSFTNDNSSWAGMYREWGRGVRPVCNN
jgi:hypothetical protein